MYNIINTWYISSSPEGVSEKAQLYLQSDFKQGDIV